jgi:ribosomal protein S18 acetylase RimI-like enzyme
MFAVASSQRRSGLGRKLIDFAEKEARLRGCTIMELEVLMPDEGNHVFKDILKVWYPKLGYRPVRREEIADVLPFLVPDMIRPGHHVVYHKRLVEES